MTSKSHAAGNTQIISRSSQLRDQAKQLRDKVALTGEQSREIREVLLVNDPPKKSGDFLYRGKISLADILDRILDRGIMVEPWRRITPGGIELSSGKGRLTTAIQTHLLNQEMVGRKKKRFRSPPFTRPEVGSLRPANFLDVLDRILDNGIIVDSWQYIHGVGIDVLGAETCANASVQMHLLYKNQHADRKASKAKAASAAI
jgi:hypothetical protein